MDLYKCAYRDPKSPLTPINPINTEHFQYGTLKSSNYSVTPLSSKASDSDKALCEPSDSTRYYTLVPQYNNSEGTFAKISSNVSSTSTRNSQKTVYQKVTEKVNYQNGKMVKILRCEQREEIFFKKASPCPRYLCPKVADWLRSSGLQRLNNLFMNEEVDYKALLLMDDYDLKDLGICCPRERAALLDLIRRKRDYWNFK